MPVITPSPVRCGADLQRLEQTPLAHAVPWASTYNLIRDTVHAYPDRTALTFLHTGQPDSPATRWTYRMLLEGMHQTDYHLALWGGEAAGIVQPLNPMLSDDKLLSLLRASGARVLIAQGDDDESGMRAKALHLKTLMPELTTLLLVTADGGPLQMASPWPDGVLDFHALRATQPADRLLSQRHFAATDIAAYFHTGGTTGAPKLARHSHGAQVFTVWANATATRCFMWPAFCPVRCARCRWAWRPSFRRRRCFATAT